ncbi:MAG TPA: DUF2171 domain-containing protein [Sphingomonas sp.]|jgi:outer membrane protein OmpA-like peptidoglycan-associated protein
MIHREQLRDGMEVIGSDGAPVGRVSDVKTGRFMFARTDGAGTGTLDLNHIERVDGDRVVLTQTGAATLGGFGARVAEATGDPVDPNAHLITGRKPGRATLLWILGALAFAAIVAFVYNRSKTEQREKLLAPAQVERGPVSPVGTGAVQPIRLPNGRTVQLPPDSTALQLNLFLSGSDAAPRSFPLSSLAFAPGQAALPATDAAGLGLIAEVLNAYPEAEAEVVGRPDGQGTDAALARRRADAVVAGLAARGAPRDRVEAEDATNEGSAPVELVITEK